MGTKEIGASCLSHLINSQQELETDIIGVLTNDRKLGSDELSVSQLAVQNGINILNNLKEFLALDDVDIVISVQYHEILKKIHLEKAKLLNVNLHMAPLPEYRGVTNFHSQFLIKTMNLARPCMLWIAVLIAEILSQSADSLFLQIALSINYTK